MSTSMTAACGLECSTCTLRTYPEAPQAAVEVLGWFRAQGWLKPDEGLDEALGRGMRCTGCHGPRDTHWSADCWILQCCVDEHGLDNCSACDGFPCTQLVAWSQGNAGYAAALQRLRSLATASSGATRGA